MISAVIETAHKLVNPLFLDLYTYYIYILIICFSKKGKANKNVAYSYI